MKTTRSSFGQVILATDSSGEMSDSDDSSSSSDPETWNDKIAWLGPHYRKVFKKSYGIDIDPMNVIPSIYRPISEPPALEIFDAFETKDWEDHQEKLEKAITNIVLRTELLDLHKESIVLGRYTGWVKRTGKDAIAAGDEKKEAFYPQLLQELRIDYVGVVQEMVPLLMVHLPFLFDDVDILSDRGDEDIQEDLADMER